jgi:hypothetical protein
MEINAKNIFKIRGFVRATTKKPEWPHATTVMILRDLLLVPAV